MKKVFVIIITQLMCAVGIMAQTQQELRDSVSVLSSMIERNPGDLSLRLKKAALNIELGQWQYALNEYNSVIDVQPDNLTALFYRAYVNTHLGRLPFARLDYESVLLREPQHMQSMIGLVFVNLEEGRKTVAFDGANRLVEMFPDSACVYDVRAEVEQTLGMLPAAIDDEKKAIEMEEQVMKRRNITRYNADDDIVCYLLRAFDIYLASDDKENASALLEQLVRQGIPRAALTDYFSRLEKK